VREQPLIGPEPGIVERIFGRFADVRFGRVAKNSGWTVAATVVTIGAIFVETILLARYLGSHTYGVYLLVLAYPQAVQLFLDFRTREALTRYLSGFLATRRFAEAVAVTKLLWLIDAIVVSCAFIIVFTTAPWVGPRLTGNPSSTILIQISAIGLLIGGLDSIAGSIIRVYDRFKLAFATSVAAMSLRLSIFVILVVFGAGIKTLVWAPVLSELCTTLILGTTALILLRASLGQYRRSPISTLRSRYREIAGFLFHTNLMSAIRAAATKLDVLTVGLVAGPSAASTYKISVQFGSIPMVLADPLLLAVYPAFGRLAALGKLEALRSIGRRASLAVGAVATPVTLFLAAGSGVVITGVLGKGYEKATVPMAIVLVGVLPSAVLFWGRAAILALGDAKYGSLIIATATGIQFGLLLALTPSFGPDGAAVGFAAMNVSVSLLTAMYLLRKGLI
jgi:O-antigen/teichoic acid export membrane protein